MKVIEVEDWMKYAVNVETFNTKKKPQCLYTVLYFDKHNPTVSLLCKSYITYFSRISGPEEEKKQMAFYNLVCYLPKGWQEKIPQSIKYLYKLHDDFTESLSLRIMKTRNESACRLNPNYIHPVEIYPIDHIITSTYTTFDEAQYEYADAILNNKKPE